MCVVRLNHMLAIMLRYLLLISMMGLCTLLSMFLAVSRDTLVRKRSLSTFLKMFRVRFEWMATPNNSFNRSAGQQGFHLLSLRLSWMPFARARLIRALDCYCRQGKNYELQSLLSAKGIRVR